MNALNNQALYAPVFQPFAPLDTLVRGVAKVFMTGRSQAIRLPKEFRFNTKEVIIERQGDALVLRPKVQTKDEWWENMMTILDGFEGMPLEIERDRTPLADPVSFDAN